MAFAFPYTFISCPCSDLSRRSRLLASKRTSRELDFNVDYDLDEEEQTLDPQHPRSNFSLFPPEHLLYCEECHDIKCSRCTTEEIICWYCPSCLFESAPSTVKGDSNRCSRNCFTCPLCTSQLITASVGESQSGPWILSCNYCMWSTLDIGIKFSHPNGIRAQLDKIANGEKLKQQYQQARPPLTSKDSYDARKSALGREPFSPADIDNGEDPMDKMVGGDGIGGENESDGRDRRSQPRLGHQARFDTLRSFYKEQILASDSSWGSSALDAAFSSPSSLSRIMSLYSGGGGGTVMGLLNSKAKQKSSMMREALTIREGLQISTDSDMNDQDKDRPDEDLLEGLQDDFHSTATFEQQSLQYPASLGNPSAHSVSDLRPMPALLRTKRSKRCAECKHILVKPDLKVTSTRYRVKLVALNYIPLVTLKPLPLPGGLKPAGPDGNPNVVLSSGTPSQWILTLRNPLFENVTVSLGSPSVTPGRYGHRVTILCPEFSIGKNGDVWDDALRSDSSERAKAQTATAGDQVAGKVYESGRNWTSVVIEIVPSNVRQNLGSNKRGAGRSQDEGPKGEMKEKRGGEKHNEYERGQEQGDMGVDEPEAEDEDVIEIPIRVTLGWKITNEELLKSYGKKSLGDEGDVDDGRRELAYWMVLGIGRVARNQGPS